MDAQKLMLDLNFSGEKDLVQSLVFDARATQIDPKKCGSPKAASKE